MYLPLFALLHAQHGLVTAAQLRDAGVTSAELRRLTKSGTLVRLRRGVYVDGELWRASDPFRAQPILRVRAAGHALAAKRFVYSHDSASIVLGFGAPDPRTSLVHVTRHKVHGDAIRAGVKHHLAPHRPNDVTEVEGLRLLGPARTALDMVREHGRSHGLAACDAALRAGTSREELQEVLALMNCWPHSQCMRWCIEHADGASESYLESLGRDFVLELGIGTPILQFGLSDGQQSAFVDILVARHFIEVDGSVKYADDNPTGVAPMEVLRREKERHDFLTGFKLGSSRLTHEDLFLRRGQALRRVAREFADTCARFGTDRSDLAPFLVTRRGPRRAS